MSGPKTHLRQGQGGEQAAGAGADDDGAFGWGGRVGGEAVARVGGRAEGRVGGEERGFVADLDVDGVNEADRGAAAGVVAAAGDGEGEQIGRGNLQAREDGVAQGVGGVVEGEFQFGQAEHGVALSDMAGVEVDPGVRVVSRDYAASATVRRGWPG